MKNLLSENYGLHLPRIKSLLITMILVLVIGCDSILEEEPESFLSSQQVFTSEDGAVASTRGIYQSLRGFSYYDRWFTAMTLMFSDYVNGRGSQQPVGQYMLDSQNINRIGSIWGAIYESINRANIVIKNIGDIEGIDPVVRNQLEGEARFLRALGYFNLVRLWGGVPLKLEPTSGPDDIDFPRASVDEIYSIIIEDLQFADENLPPSPPESGRATKWAAKTLLANVFLTRERWSDAAAKAKEVIDSGEFSLETVETSEDFHINMFGPDVGVHSGEIFSIEYTQSIEAGWLGWLHKPGIGFSSGGVFAWWGELDAFIGQDEWSTEDSPDLRRNAFLYSGPFETSFLDEEISMLFSKFRGSPANEGVDMPIMRYAEVLYIFAEAESQANGGPTDEAYEAVNQVRRRAYGKDLNTPDPGGADLPGGLSAEEFRDAVILDRGKEFIAERKRWFDLLRTNTALEIIGGELGKAIQPRHLKWPIAQEEIDNNPALSEEDQNPGW